LHQLKIGLQAQKEAESKSDIATQPEVRVRIDHSPPVQNLDDPPNRHKQRAPDPPQLIRRVPENRVPKFRRAKDSEGQQRRWYLTTST
jgi:hypothetical protein